MTNTELSSALKIMLGTTEASEVYMGSTLLWSRCPYDAELEYLECTGTQYIDLLFKPSTNKVTVQTEVCITNISQDSTIVGTVDENSNVLRFYPIGFSNKKFYSCSFSGSWNSSYSLNSSVVTADTFYTVQSTIYDTVTLSVNQSTLTQARSEGFNSSKSLFLFARNEVNIGHFAKCKMKYLKIYESDVLIMDLIPVRIGQTGYMYDKISRQLFGNSGTGTFVLGNDIIKYQQNGLPAGYIELEYIESSTSGQYIDLDIKLYETLDTQYDIATKFNILGAGQDNTQSFLFGCQNVTSPWPGTFIRLSSSSATDVTGRYIGANVKDNVLGSKNTVIELPVQTSPNKNVYNLSNGGQTHSFGTSLFCSFSDANNTPYKFVSARLYYFKLFVSGTLVRDLIPCKNNNNVVGMYDVANNVFYTSPNGAAFIAGPAV